jgi:hypothetical protein
VHNQAARFQMYYKFVTLELQDFRNGQENFNLAIKDGQGSYLFVTKILWKEAGGEKLSFFLKYHGSNII